MNLEGVEVSFREWKESVIIQLAEIDTQWRKYEESDDMVVMQQTLKKIAGYLIYLPKVLATARGFVRERQRVYLEGLLAASSKMSPNVMRDMQKIYANEELMLSEWIDTLNNNLLQVCSSLQTTISFQKKTAPFPGNT